MPSVTITVNGKPVQGITGTPAFIQSAFGKQGNFEMLVPVGERLVHYWRDNDTPGYPWHQGSDVIPAPTVTSHTKNAVNGVALLESTFGGNLEAVVWLHPESSAVIGTQGGGTPQDYLERVHTIRSASTMSANERNPRKRTSSFSKREKIRRNPFSLRNSRSISLRFL